MGNQTFFPSTEATQIVWLTHYRSRITVHGPVCGIGPEEIAETLKDLDRYIWILQLWHPATQHAAREATVAKAEMIGGSGTEPLPIPTPPTFPDEPEARPPGLKKRLLNQIVRIKASAGCTDAIALDLGIVNTSTPTDHPVPEIGASAELGSDGPRVRLDFNKYGHDGIWIECRINGGDWAFLAIDTVKPSRRASHHRRQRPRNPRIPGPLVGQKRAARGVEWGGEGGFGGLSGVDQWKPAGMHSQNPRLAGVITKPITVRRYGLWVSRVHPTHPAALKCLNSDRGSKK